jgi:hypothetical protein
MMLNNAFIVSNLERHQIGRFEQQAIRANQVFLSKIDSHLAERSAYFAWFMTSLKEDISEKEIKQQLLEYMTSFIQLTISKNNLAHSARNEVRQISNTKSS